MTAQTFLYIFDANGNVDQLVDATDGTIAAHYEYDPFGNLLVITGSEADNNVFRFSTKYYDVETGLYDYGYRYYDPVLGRWMTRDPIGEEGELNLYGFVWNNPIVLVDTLGLIPAGLPFDRVLDDLLDLSPSRVKGLGVVKGAGAGIEWFVNGKIVTKLKGYDLYISGSPNPLSPPKPKTSVLYVWRKGNVDSNLLRLDLHELKGYEGKQWHWNPNERDILKKIDMLVPDHIPTKTARYAGKTLKVVRYAGKVFLVAGIASSAYEIYAADDRMKEVVRQAGGWAGAAGGAWAGGKGGAWAGGAICSWTGFGIGPCAITGGIIGSAGGGIIGWWGGSVATGFVYERWFTPLEIEEYVISDCQDDENAGAGF